MLGSDSIHFFLYKVVPSQGTNSFKKSGVKKYTVHPIMDPSAVFFGAPA